MILPLSWVLITRMEGELPQLSIDLSAPEIGAEKTLHLKVHDFKSGLKHVWIGIFANGKESTVLEKDFPAVGLLRSGTTRSASMDLGIDAKKLGLQDGPAMLRLVAVDHSWRKWGEGNRTYLEKEIL